MMLALAAIQRFLLIHHALFGVPFPFRIAHLDEKDWALGVLKYASGQMSSFCLRLAARNDFVFLLTPFKEKVAAESCVTLSTYDTGRSGRSQTGESWMSASVRKCGFLYAHNCRRCDAPIKIKMVIRAIGAPVV
jgi:hypothetical protein